MKTAIEVLNWIKSNIICKSSLPVIIKYIKINYPDITESELHNIKVSDHSQYIYYTSTYKDYLDFKIFLLTNNKDHSFFVITDDKGKNYIISDIGEERTIPFSCEKNDVETTEAYRICPIIMDICIATQEEKELLINNVFKIFKLDFERDYFINNN